MIRKELKTYIVLILLLAITASVSVFLPQGSAVPVQELPASKITLAVITFIIMVLIYGGLGLIGLTLSKKISFAGIWEEGIPIHKKVFQPLIIGAGLGVLFIFLDILFSDIFAQKALPHPPFPLSLAASITAAIGEEIIARLFFIPFWVWLISFVMLKKRYFNQIFWGVTCLSAAVFTIMHIPSILVLYDLKEINQIPSSMLFELFIMNGSLSFFTAYHLRKFGFLAAVGIHFWTDVVWHVIFGLL